jgi:SAM-dependent methyltransferase
MFDINFLNQLRSEELRLVINEFGQSKRILDFGAGTGLQAKDLGDYGFDVLAIDLPKSDFSQNRVYKVLEYDGKNIPLIEGSIDVIFSSNVLEHVNNLTDILSEFRRVLCHDGYCILIMPSVSWRFWTFLSGIPTALIAFFFLCINLFLPPNNSNRGTTAASFLKIACASLLPIGHGVSKEGISELWTFSTLAWRSLFQRNGFCVQSCYPIGLFHTGHMLLGRNLSLEKRKRYSTFLGSAANVYVVKPMSSSSSPRKNANINVHLDQYGK